MSRVSVSSLVTSGRGSSSSEMDGGMEWNGRGGQSKSVRWFS